MFKGLNKQVGERLKQAGYNYYPELDKYFKLLHFINKDWFKVRDKLTRIEEKELFELMLKIMLTLEKLNDKVKDIKIRIQSELK